jgi:hypothetical protein
LVRKRDVEALREHEPSVKRILLRSSICRMTFTQSTAPFGASLRMPRPWTTRDASFSMVIAAISPDAKDAEALRNWGRAYWEAIHPFNLKGAYVNFMDADEAENGSS